MASTPFPGRFSRVQQPSDLNQNQQQVADQSDEFRKKYAGGVDAPEEAGAQQDDVLPHWEKPGTQEGYIGVGPGAGSAADTQFESELASAPRFSSTRPPTHLLSDAELDTAIGDARHAGDAQRVNELQQEAISRTRDADTSFGDDGAPPSKPPSSNGSSRQPDWNNETFTHNGKPYSTEEAYMTWLDQGGDPKDFDVSKAIDIYKNHFNYIK